MAPLLLASVALLAIFDLTARPWASIVALAGAVAAFVWALHRLAARAVRASWILSIAALLRICLLPLPPSLSDDVYRYLWDGRIAAFGWNPYFHAPHDPELGDLRDELWERVAHREVETVYPPLAIAAFSIASRLPWPVLGWKAMLVAIDLLSCLVLLRLARAREVPTGRVIAYAWNPMAVLEVAGMGHVDALGVLPMLVAALFLIEPHSKHAAIASRRSAAAAAALALAILAKLVPLLLAPAWARASTRRLLFVVTCVVVIAVAAVPFAIGAPGTPPGLVTYAVSWEWNGPLFEPLWRALDWAGAVPWAKARLDDLEAATGHDDFWNPLYHYVYPQFLAKIVLAIAMAGVVIASLRRADPIEAALWVLGGVLVLSATVYPWYALWVLPLAALQWSVPWLVLSLSLLASYIPRLLDVPLLPWPFLLVWVPFVIALLDEAPARVAARGRSNHRLTIAYLGGGFAGWQRQINALSVQEVVETALERLVGEPVRLHGASRTDAGVHAAGQEAHVTLARSWPARTLIEGTNHYLPSSVRVLRSLAVAPDFHAREWAVAKEYHYRMSRRPVLLPFESATTVRVPDRLDLERLRAATALLEGRHDWSAFASAGGSHRQTFRRVFSAEVVEEGAELELRIKGDGFLRGMVRALVGSLLWVANGRLSLDRWRELLEGADRAAAGPSAPAHGLVLMRVFYPEETSDR